MKTKIYKFLFLSAILCVAKANTISAQTQIPCGTSEFTNALRAAHPELEQQALDYENELNQKIAQKEERSSVLHIIPIVFHVIHVNGSENIPDINIFNQVDRLNKDFRKQNSDTTSIVAAFQPIAADCNIEFRLAQKDPNGNCTNGIDRIYSHKTFNADDYSKLNQWPRDKYFNVWVITNIPNGTTPGTILAYAHFPSSVAGFLYPYDGVIMISSQCNGSSRTLTHEIGHWLSLEHTWGGGQVATACGDDAVSDTPPTKGHFSTCPPYDSTCSTGTATPNILENIQNYMDYSSCIFMFTVGQRDRMRAALESPTASRNNLYLPSNLAATGVDGSGVACAPVAEFYANRYSVCAGGTVTFTKNILNTIGTAATIAWSFPGSSTTGTPSTSPITVTYPTPGLYPVTLTATNSTGTNTITKTDYIKVNAGAEFFGPQTENFEAINDYFYFWESQNLDAGSNGWGLSSSTGYSGTRSVVMSGYNNYANDVDNLISASYNLSGLTGIQLSFRCAAASRATSTADMTDQLKVYSSIDCGATWFPRKTFPAVATPSLPFPLINAGYHPEFFVPNSASQWQLQTISPLPASLAVSNVRFKFEYTTGVASNNIYIDDVNITGTVGIAENTFDESNVSVFPNPTNQTSTLYYHLNSKGNTNIQLVDVLGKKLMEINNKEQSEGDYTISISKQSLGLKSGIYFIKLTVNNNSITKKLIVTE